MNLGKKESTVLPTRFSNVFYSGTGVDNSIDLATLRTDYPDIDTSVCLWVIATMVIECIVIDNESICQFSARSDVGKWFRFREWKIKWKSNRYFQKGLDFLSMTPERLAVLKMFQSIIHCVSRHSETYSFTIFKTRKSNEIFVIGNNVLS